MSRESIDVKIIVLSTFSWENFSPAEALAGVYVPTNWIIISEMKYCRHKIFLAFL